MVTTIDHLTTNLADNSELYEMSKEEADFDGLVAIDADAAKLEATIAARRELGPAHDDQLVAGFLDRIEKEIDRRVDERIALRGPTKRAAFPFTPGRSVSASRSSRSRAESAVFPGCSSPSRRSC